jgi:hypothetical protein
MSRPAGGHRITLTRVNLPIPPLVAHQGVVPPVHASGNHTAGPKLLR